MWKRVVNDTVQRLTGYHLERAERSAQLEEDLTAARRQAADFLDGRFTDTCGGAPCVATTG